MEKTIKFRLFHYYVEQPNMADPQGNNVLVEKFASLGQTVDIPRQEDLQRGEELGAFFSDEEAEAIANGTFQGPTRDIVYRSRSGVIPAQISEEGGSASSGEINVKSASSDELGEYIRENKLTVQDVKDLVPDDADTELLEKVWDAESYATDNEPRKGVTDFLDARLAAAAEAGQ
jgi:hypothetical protein